MDAPADRELAPGTDVGGYVVEAELGHGGMGVVYRATHPVIGKRVAIKVLRPEVAEHPDAIERFTQEARAVNQIGHPNIVDIFGFGTMPDGRAYLVMALLEGESLRTRLRRGALHPSEAASIIDETASALVAVHDKGFIHRDLKPDNVFLVPHEGRWADVKLLDFGLAKLVPQQGPVPFRTKTGVTLGTPDYMAPEVVRKRAEIDYRVDHYALGVMAFEMLVGERPFASLDGAPFDKMQAVVETPAPPVRELAPDVPEDLAQLVDALLAKEREDRPSLGAVRAVIKRLRGSQLPSPSLVAMTAVSQTVPDAPAVRTQDLGAITPDGPRPSSAGRAMDGGVASLPEVTYEAAPASAWTMREGVTAVLPDERAPESGSVPTAPIALPRTRTDPGNPALRTTGAGGTVLGVAPAPRISRNALPAAAPPRRAPRTLLVALALALVAAGVLAFALLQWR